MGHWSIYKVDDGSNPLDEIWGDEEADRTGEYLEYLAGYESKRLENKEGLIEDISVLIWDVLYELEEGRKATRDEIKYGLDFSSESAIGVPLNTEHADETSTFPELSGYTDPLMEYLEYLQETDYDRLQSRAVLLNDFRVLTWETFKNLRNRPARTEELEYLLNLCLEPFH